MIDAALVALLACPCCDERPPLVLEEETLRCTVCGRRYPIVDGIARLLPESALPDDDPMTSS